jgi:DNA-directed RNA polymerase specialized sigma24 family protein
MPTPADLVRAWHRYAFTVAARAGARFPWLVDDLISDCLLVLFYAARRHTPDRGEFKGYLAFRLRGAISRRLRVERRRNRAAFQRAVSADPELDPLAIVADPLAIVADPRGDSIAGVDLLTLLPVSVRADVEAHWFGGLTFGEIGAARGVAGSTVGQRVRTAMGRAAAHVAG